MADRGSPPTNHLADATSPYLLLHAHNPVDWYPWGEEAFSLASELDRPILVSIGYSACHWCHVMADESFEDLATAAMLNANFVSIKVDREERPDIDAIYLEAVQLLTGQGGWPLTAFLTADGRPFFGGTYFPADSRRGSPTFTQLLRAIDELWRSDRAEVERRADALLGGLHDRLGVLAGLGQKSPSTRAPAPQATTASPTPITKVAARESGPGEALEHLTSSGGLVTQLGPFSTAELDELRRSAVAELATRFDSSYAGFGDAPKFPQPELLDFLARAARSGEKGALSMLEETLGAIAAGGIYDHLGGGIARYSVDRAFLIPHFEKMLYDQALLGRVYLHAWQLTGNPAWRQVVYETIRYVTEELADREGGYFSAEDADSEGEEGRYYLWSTDQLVEALGEDDGAAAAAYYRVSAAGNFGRGVSVLSRERTGDLARDDREEAIRAALYRYRSRRVRPAVDDKVLTEWNAMFCSFLAETALATGDAQIAATAKRLADVLLLLAREDGRYLRSRRAGTTAHLAYATDYAWLVDALTRMAELTGQVRYLGAGLAIAEALIDLFADDIGGGLFLTGRDAPALVVRPRDVYDGVTPSATSVAAVAFARLHALTGDEKFADRAVALVGSVETGLRIRPTAFPRLFHAAELLAGGITEIVVTGDRRDLSSAAGALFLPDAVLVHGDLASHPAHQGTAAAEVVRARRSGLAYLCRAGRCLAPLDEAGALVVELTGDSRRPREQTRGVSS